MDMTLFDQMITPVEEVLEKILNTSEQMMPAWKMTYWEKMGFAYEFIQEKETDITTNAFHVVLELNGGILCVVSTHVKKTDLSIDEYNLIRERSYLSAIAILGALGVPGLVNRVQISGKEFFYIHLDYDSDKPNRKA